MLPHDLDLKLVKTTEDVFECKRWLSSNHGGSNVLGFDTETSGLDAWAPGARIRMIQIGDTHTGWAIPYEQWGGLALECLDAWEGRWVAHNLAFDAIWMQIHAGYRMPWHRCDDTYIQARIIEPDKPADLKRVSDAYIDPRASEGQKKLKKDFKTYNWDWNTIPIDWDNYWVYAALDPVLARTLHDHYKIDDRYAAVYELEMAMLRIATDMQIKGMRVDLDYSRAKYNELSGMVESTKDRIMREHNVLISSNDQLVDYFTKSGAQFSVFTAKNAPSVDKNQLAIFMRDSNKDVSEMAKLVVKTRGAAKVADAYFSNFDKFSVNGIVHPTIKTLGARTGRMSVTDPALQTIPRGDALVRDAFIPSDEGELMLSCDYSQVEMRLLSHFSGDEKLRTAFREADETGGDFFVTLGKEIYADPNFAKSDGRRGLVKGTMYGAAYGSGIQKMADTAGVSYDQMKTVTESVFRTYPGIRNFMQEIEKVGKGRERDEGQGYVLTQMGRRLPCDQGKVYALTNYILQGTAAELMKKSIIKLDASGFLPYMRMPIHDEMIFSLPEDIVHEASKEIEEIMSYVNNEFSVDLPAEPEAGMHRWGDKYRKEGEIFGYNAEEAILNAKE